ncbi:MAG: hypothetical protein R3E60_01145 [Alphaproteobacteria bacterium]
MYAFVSRSPRRLMALVAMVLWAAAVLPHIAYAQQKDAAAMNTMKLFKIVSTKDEVIIGVGKEDLPGTSANPDLGAIAEALNASGYINAWLYAPRRGPKGEVQQAPSRRISIFAQSIVRIEEYTTDQEIVPPGK